MVQACREAGIEVRLERIVRGGFDAPGGHETAVEMLEACGCLDAIFAANDFAANGAMGVLRERGISVPDDIAVVGYNDNFAGRGASHPAGHQPLADA